jgi:uncharacterized protein (TIGR04255 family)
MPKREVYGNAPLRLVTAEFRFPLSPLLSGSDLLSLLADTLGETFPIIEPAPQGLQLSFGPESPVASSTGNGYRLLARDRTSSVTVTPSRVAIETTAYRHWEDFREELVRVALSALGDNLGALVGIDRIGLRYINEVRVPGDSLTTDDWKSYINPDLLAVTNIATGAAVKTAQMALHLQTSDDAELLIRLGILEGHVVDNSTPLRLPSAPQNGPFFLIDIDSFWTRTGTVNEWDTSAAIETANSLHAPIDDLFELCITERLRADVLRSPQ